MGVMGYVTPRENDISKRGLLMFSGFRGFGIKEVQNIKPYPLTEWIWKKQQINIPTCSFSSIQIDICPSIFNLNY